jgi:hypothetical protein
MFCLKCGTNNEGVSSYCTKCGSPIENESIKPAKTNNMKFLLNKKLWVIAGAVLALLVIFIIVSNQPKKINVEEFIEISYNGYSGYATARANLDEDSLFNAISVARGTKDIDLEDLDDIESLFSNYKNYNEAIECIDSIDMIVSPSANVSNGDNIKVDISYDNKIAKKYKIKFTGNSITKKVEGLKPIEKIDPFKDLSISFSGIAPNGIVDYDYNNDNSNINTYSFSVNNRNGLRNGDVVTFSIDFSDVDTLRNGYILTEKEKQFVVEGLEEYIDKYAALSSTFIDVLKSETKDTILAYIANSYIKECNVNDLTYAGYILNSSKTGSTFFMNNNDLYIIYSGMASHTEGKFTTTKVYFPVKFSNIIKNGNDISYNDKSGVVGNSNFNNSWSYYTKGYINPLICYMELAQANLDNYKVECGDGFEDYAEQKSITKLSDISDDYRNELISEANNIIENYVAKDYSSSSHLEGLAIKGEYLLISKNQGTSYDKNNKYIVVYSGTLSSDEEKFETTDVYFPVEYDGLVGLPKDEYIFSSYKGILGNSYLGTSWFSYSTKGYTDGAQMFKDIVTANRDIYTYEVSDGLKEFGE